MAERTPNRRASYEAAATKPPSRAPPTATFQLPTFSAGAGSLAEGDVAQPREAAPHHSIPRRRISASSQIAAEPCELGQIGGKASPLGACCASGTRQSRSAISISVNTSLAVAGRQTG